MSVLNMQYNELNNRWRRILSTLRSEFGNTAHKSWLSKIKVKSISENKMLILACSNSSLEQFICNNYLPRIQQLWLQEEIGLIGVNLVLDTDSIYSNDLDDTPISETDITDELYLDPKFTFNNFVVNETNKFAFQASQQVSNFSAIFNPLYICGGVGLGKTHLLHAIASNIRENSPTKKIIYLSAERFATKFINAIRNQDITAFKNDLRSVDVLLVDDIQFMSGKISTQQEFFHTFNDLMSRGCQIIISGNVAPSYLENFDERIISRFSGGIVTEIKRANYELRCFVLKQKSKMLGYDLNQEIIQYLATSIDSNMRELEGALNRIIAYSSSMNGQVMDVESISQILEDLLQKSRRKITIDDIKKVVSDYFKIQMKDLNSSRRNREIARPRQIAIWLCKELTTNSLPEIGKKFNRDHTTVLHAINRVEEMISSDDKISNDILSLKRHIK
ncbi:MAG: chromosomal replication initiator protein DnaA [Alphaproteobacteria bacterium]|nr:chromosomal replication initiator protein DnaA [Alphaproteobacteria bacterium]